LDIVHRLMGRRYLTTVPLARKAHGWCPFSPRPGHDGRPSWTRTRSTGSPVSRSTGESAQRWRRIPKMTSGKIQNENCCTGSVRLCPPVSPLL
jgi:hypothetical protein